jgi:hypothetical protein
MIRARDLALQLGLSPSPPARRGAFPACAGAAPLEGGRAALWVAALDRFGARDEDRRTARRLAARRVLARSRPGDLALIVLVAPSCPLVEIVLPRPLPRGGPPALVRAVLDPGAPRASHARLLSALAIRPGETAAGAAARWRRALDPDREARRAIAVIVRGARPGHPGAREEVLRAVLAALFGGEAPSNPELGALLASWRFTASESVAGDRSWDPDPSLLGPLLHALRDPGERAARGGFDTPPAVARHLCRRALDAYLAHRAGAKPAALAALRAAGEETATSRPEVSRAAPRNARALDRALDAFRACDPAAGTGALLVAMREEIVLLRAGLARLRGVRAGPAARARWRARAVSRSLFGIDSDAEALALCAARLGHSPARLLHADALDDIPAPFPAAFDAVIANPPYVRHERLGADRKRRLASRYADVHRGRADLHVFFCARAVELLRPGGALALVTSGKFLRAGYGEGLRAHLARVLTLTEVIDLGDLPAFDAAAYPVLIAGRRARPGPRHALRAADLAAHREERGNGAGRDVLEAFDRLVAREARNGFRQARLGARPWRVDAAGRSPLPDDWASRGVPLGEIVGGRMYRGVVTGLNRAFVIDARARDALLARDPRAAEILRPWIRGRDVGAYRAAPSGLTLIHAERGTDLSRYPGVAAHLARFRARLTPRAPGGPGPGRKPGTYRWFEIQDRIAYAGAFAEPKIVFSKFVTRPRFAWDESGAFTSNATGILPGAPPWLVAVLSSDLVWFLLRRRLTRLQNGYYQLMNANLLALRVVVPGHAARSELSDIVRRLAEPTHQARGLRDRAEGLVRSAYGLDREASRRLAAWTSGSGWREAGTCEAP